MPAPETDLPTPPQDFRVVAIVSVRNDSIYLERCLRQMQEQGVEACVIDNDADAATREIIDRHRGRGVFRVHHHPHPGWFDWEGILREKLRLAGEIEADWFVFWDTDEIREPPPPFSDLRQAFHTVQERGYDSVDFDEFVFLPTDESESFVGRDYVAEMKHYYLFRPRPHNRLTAWKRTDAPLDAMTSGGHQVRFPGQRIWPEGFVMRHYLFLSWEHAISKYCVREYSPAELARGWSRERALLTPENLRLPDRAEMREYRGDSIWLRDAPLAQHPCFPRPVENPLRRLASALTRRARRLAG